MSTLNVHITKDQGVIALWIGFAITLFSSIAFVLFTYVFTKEVKKYNYLAALINIVSAVAYLIMALGETEMGIPEKLNDGKRTRGMLWLRYANRAITWPLITYTLAQLANGDKSETYFNIFLNLVIQAALFAGAISLGTNAAWPLLGLGLAAFFPVVISLLGGYRKAANAQGSSIGTLYTFLAIWTLTMWVGDVVVWGTAEAGKVATPDQEVIAYSTLDVASYSVFGFVLVLARRAIAKNGSVFGGASQTLSLPANGKTVTVNVVNGQLVVSDEATA